MVRQAVDRDVLGVVIVRVADDGLDGGHFLLAGGQKMAGQGLEMPVKAFRGVQGRFRPGKAQGKPGVDMVQGGASEQIGRVFERCRDLFQMVDIIHGSRRLPDTGGWDGETV